MLPESLPLLDSRIAISQDQINSFREKGHTLLQGVLSTEEVTAYREAINSAAYRFNTEKRELKDRGTYGWTLHAAPGNSSAQTREVMTIIYFADGSEVIKPQNKHQEADRMAWLDGLQPGEKAASKHNPLVL